MEEDKDSSQSNIIKNLKREDFQGSTNFKAFSASQKLEWLAQAADFVSKAQRSKEK